MKTTKRKFDGDLPRWVTEFQRVMIPADLPKMSLIRDLEKRDCRDVAGRVWFEREFDANAVQRKD